MDKKEVNLSSKAIKLLTDYSEAEGITPSEAVSRLVPKSKKVTVASLMKKASAMSEAKANALLASPRTKGIADAKAAKIAREAVRRHRNQ